MRKTLSVLALLLSLLTVLSFGSFAVSAESSEELSVSVEETTSEAVASDDATTEETSEDATTEAETTEAETTEEETSEEADVSVDNTKSFPWALVIFLALVVIFVVVCIVCIKKENKFGLWLKKFFKDYKSEIKKIVWPSKDFTVKSTIVVIVCLLICAGVIGLLDVGLNALVLWLIDLVG